MAPEVTLLMPAYRPDPAWLREAVAAALAEPGCELELIVVDDGSEAPVADLLAHIDDPRLEVLAIPHEGPGAARNAGIARSRGAYLRYLDADDVLVRGSTATLLALATAHPGSIAYGATEICDEDLRPRWTMRSRLRGDVARDCLLGRFTVRPPAMLFPREAVERAGPWDPAARASSDWDWALRAVEQAPVVGTTEVVYRYRRHGDSITGERFASGIAAADEIVTGYLQRHPGERGIERRARAMVAALGARVFLTHGDRRAALRHGWAALRLDPRSLLGELRRGMPAVLAKLHR